MPAPELPVGRPVIIAHRGASGLAPENTLTALRLAADLGADRAEVDVQLTADGVPVLLHDATLNRTTNGRGRLAELRFDDINALDAGHARRFGNRWRGARIPTLDEALRVTSARGLPLCIEIKAPGEAAALVEKTVAAVAAAGLAEQAWIWSFNPAHLARVRRLSPATPLGILSFGWPSAAGAEVADMLVPLAGHALLFDADLAPRAGKPLIIWTVNQPRVARALAARGAAGLITDRAERMVPLLGGGRTPTASAPAPTARASRR